MDGGHETTGEWVATVTRGDGARPIELKRGTAVTAEDVVVCRGEWKQVKIFAMRHSWKVETRRPL